MRNFYYLIFLLSLGMGMKAQTYMPMLDQHNEWQVISCYMGDCFKDIYYTDGDTLVNGQQHKILDGYHYISRSFLLREEVDTKKVFLTTHINNHIDEYLLYDFSLAEGDTIYMNNPITPFPPEGGYYKVDSIRQRPIMNQNQGRFFYFSPAPSNDAEFTFKPIWVEGLGSLSIVTAPGGSPDYDGVGQVSCFFKNGNLFYFDGEMQESCSSVFLTKDPSKTFFAQFHVQQNWGIIRSEVPMESVEIYSITGEFIRKESGKNQNNLEINLQTLKKGAYILRLKSSNNQFKSIKFLLK
jgi:hypothetical protein